MEPRGLFVEKIFFRKPEKSDDLAINGQVGVYVVIGRDEDYNGINPFGSADKVGSAE